MAACCYVARFLWQCSAAALPDTANAPNDRKREKRTNKVGKKKKERRGLERDAAIVRLRGSRARAKFPADSGDSSAIAVTVSVRCVKTNVQISEQERRATESSELHARYTRGAIRAQAGRD